MTNRVEQILQFLRIKPGDAFLTHALAMEYIKTGEREKARTTLEHLLNEQPDYVGSYYHLAGLLAQMGEKDLAIDWYHKGIHAARSVGDLHAVRELQSALEELMF